MTFEEFLENATDFDGDVFTDYCEPDASFVWYCNEISMTDECKERFADILALPVEVRREDLVYLDTSASDVADDDLGDMLNEFVCAVAGFIPVSEYESLFSE